MKALTEEELRRKLRNRDVGQRESESGNKQDIGRESKGKDRRVRVRVDDRKSESERQKDRRVRVKVEIKRTWEENEKGKNRKERDT